MSLYNRTVYATLNLLRNKNSIKVFNFVLNNENSNLILPKLYLGNIIDAHNPDIMKKYNIEAILNCTESEPFHKYFEDKTFLRIDIKDSLDDTNVEKFIDKIEEGVDFIDYNINTMNKTVYVHCYWGLMRSATVVAAYLIKKYKCTIDESISIVKEKRPYSISEYYNFNKVLKEYSRRIHFRRHNHIQHIK
jgi:dual specificity MAP kinase phosphatase